MCFTGEYYEWVIGDYDYHVEECGKNHCRCRECGCEIGPGELLWSVWQEEETDSWDEWELANDIPETFRATICGACELTRFRIHCHELMEGCHESESWCPFGELRDYCHSADFEFSTHDEGREFLRWKMCNREAKA
jgi:hypothetical protein